MLFQKFFWRSFFFFLAMILISSILFGGLLYRNLYRSNLEMLKNNLEKQTQVLAQIAMRSENLLDHPDEIAKLAHVEDRITLIAPDGRVLADNWAMILGKEALENHANRPEFRAALNEQPTFVRRFSNTLKREMLYYAVPVKKDNQIAFVLRLSFPLTTFYEQMATVRNFLLLTAFSAILLSLPFVLALSREITHPIQRLRASTNRLASGELEQRVSAKGSQEFQELAADFNKMADELREKITSIKQEHQRTEALLSKMVEGVLAIDRHGKAIFANPAFCNMMGVKTIQGRSVLEMIRNHELSDYIAQLLKIEAQKSTSMERESSENWQAREIKIYAPDGEKTFSVQASRIQDSGTPVALLLVFHDITRIKMIEQIRKDFVANVSHELRTPLTALKGSTELLLDGAYLNPEECKKFLKIMDKQLQNIQNLISDMLMLAAVEDTRTATRREVVDLKSFIAEILSMIEPLAMKKHQIVKAKLPETNVHLNIDPSQISDALINLLDNAIKYTQEHGSIDFIVHNTDDGIIFEVHDNGSGIPRDQLPRVFERFYRVDKSRSKEMGGTGLGLAIAKHAVENHGGSITVQSEPGRGTSFYVKLPQNSVLQTI
jgi:two-component system phosphate regulon sensor histidine kinase PhoR